MKLGIRPGTSAQTTLGECLRMPFREFWRLYLDAHRHPATRGVHYAATLLGIAGTVLAILLWQPLVSAAGIVIAVIMAVASHWYIEGNQPLIRINPFFGAAADLRMCWLALTGGLAAEYARLGLGTATPHPGVLPAE